MTRPIRVAVEKINAPHAEMSTAGVIIAVSTASALAGASSRVSQSTRPFYARLRRAVQNGQESKFKTQGAFGAKCTTAKAKFKTTAPSAPSPQPGRPQVQNPEFADGCRSKRSCFELSVLAKIYRCRRLSCARSAIPRF